IEDYPAENELFEQIRLIENHVLIDANAIARELGSQKISNMVMLGAASMHLGLGTEYLEGAMNTLFGRKGEEVVALNIKALMAGKEGIRI
ncbi:MAG: 2-oxoacid:acceptor oxidoreductase family protein, partial [Bacteroidales bacterium]|nr:2-oxoacid:acceptor oxidoreductase family protein [Bacteroidales bacterium]